ncbi:MAG: cell division protein ZapE [Legionellaceae bacterium]|nr:cell division protein ZapE [Legionellaceae bacterium]
MLLEIAYAKAVKEGVIQEDPGQRQALPLLVDIQKELLQKVHWWQRKPRIRGVYLYGAVGVGKTFLLDILFQTTPIVEKRRLHFHAFMQEIDTALRQCQGRANPLAVIAKNFVKTTRLLCLDEFFVEDVACATMLSDLLGSLFQAGVVFVMTSNIKPDDLYRNGLHRERFLPTIDWIYAHTTVHELPKRVDYREGHAPFPAAFYTPLGAATDAAMRQQFEKNVLDVQYQGTMMVQHRDIPFVARGKGAAWFTFPVLCSVPRSILDYLELADTLTHLFLSDVPALTEESHTPALLFMYLIDVLYDKRIHLTFSAAVPLLEIFPSTQGLYQRSVSRLQEMQSVDYKRLHFGDAQHGVDES